MPDPHPAPGPPPRWGWRDAREWCWADLVGEAIVYLLDLLIALF